MTNLSAAAQAVLDAYWHRDRAVCRDEMLAAALLEAINQTQNGQGMISAADLHFIAMEIKNQ